MKRFAVLAVAAVIVLAACASTPNPELQRKYQEAALKIDAAMPGALRGEKAALATVCYQYYSRAWDFPSNANNDTDLAYDWCVKSGKAGTGVSANIVGDILYLRRFDKCGCFNAFPNYTAMKQAALEWYRLSEKNGYDAKKDIAAVLASLESTSASTSSSGISSQLFAGVLGSAIIAGAPGVASADKARIAAGFLSDVATDGRGQGIAAASNSIQASRPGAGSSTTATASLDQKALSASCQAQYAGPKGDPQTDSFCQLAQFNNCLDKATGTTTYRVQTRAACSQLDGLLRATRSGSAASYCQYCR